MESGRYRDYRNVNTNCNQGVGIWQNLQAPGNSMGIPTWVSNCDELYPFNLP
ncbi:hypothetical protein GCM10010038_14600 [Glutamicibacter protophormiae]|nr:hypothetical protein GCM10010038_14600 [Glutamicibacter protophormiae]